MQLLATASGVELRLLRFGTNQKLKLLLLRVQLSVCCSCLCVNPALAARVSAQRAFHILLTRPGHRGREIVDDSPKTRQRHHLPSVIIRHGCFFFVALTPFGEEGCAKHATGPHRDATGVLAQLGNGNAPRVRALRCWGFGVSWRSCPAGAAACLRVLSPVCNSGPWHEVGTGSRHTTRSESPSLGTPHNSTQPAISRTLQHQCSNSHGGVARMGVALALQTRSRRTSDSDMTTPIEDMSNNLSVL